MSDVEIVQRQPKDAETIPLENEEQQAALNAALDQKAELVHFSDGRDWDSGLVRREILSFVEQAQYCYIEIGRRLIWTKRSLGHGSFERWVEKNMPFSVRTARRHMLVSAWMIKHPRLAAPAGRLSVRKLIELTRLPPEMTDELHEAGGVGKVSIEDMAGMSYSEVKRHLDTEKKKREGLEEELDKRDKKIERLEEQLKDTRAEIGRVATAGDKDALRLVHEWREKFDGLLAMIGFGMDNLGRKLDEYSPATQLRLRGFAAYLRDYAQLEEARFRLMAGDDVFGAEFPDFQRTGEPYPLGQHIFRGREGVGISATRRC